MPLIQIVTLSALVAAKSAFAYPHPHSALYLYKRGGRPSTKPGWAVTANAIVGATIGGLLGVNTCSELPVILVYIGVRVPSWYRRWRERRRTDPVMDAPEQPDTVNVPITVRGDSEVASSITKFGTTPLTPILSRAATRESHTQPQPSPRTPQITATPLPITSAPTPEAQNASTPSIDTTPV